MITAVDTSVLLDLFTAHPRFGPSARDALRTCSREGRLIACEAVFAELGSVFPSTRQVSEAMERLGVDFEPGSVEAALVAAQAFRAYRANGGRRERVVADFLIGAHAQTFADRLLTRDRGFHRAYFKKLRVLDPSAAS